MPPHLLRCQGIAVSDYSFTLGRLESGAPSAFAQLGFYGTKGAICRIRQRDMISIPSVELEFINNISNLNKVNKYNLTNMFYQL